MRPTSSSRRVERTRFGLRVLGRERRAGGWGWWGRGGSQRPVPCRAAADVMRRDGAQASGAAHACRVVAGPLPNPATTRQPSRGPLPGGFGEVERESFELDREVDVFEADVAGTLMRAGAKLRIALMPAATSWSATACAASEGPRRSRSGCRAPSPRGRGRGSRRSVSTRPRARPSSDPRRRWPRCGSPAARSRGSERAPSRDYRIR